MVGITIAIATRVEMRNEFGSAETTARLPYRFVTRRAAALRRPGRETFGNAQPLLLGDDRVDQRTDALHGHRNLIARQEPARRIVTETDARRSARGNDVARLEREYARKMRDELGDAEDQVFRVRILQH